MINYFEILNVSDNAEAEVIRASYKALAKKYHPDNAKINEPVAAEKMRLINEAFYVLSDDNTREMHLMELRNCRKAKSDIYDNRSDVIYHDVKKNVYAEKADSIYRPEAESIISKVIVGGVVVSIICCMLYFIPDVLSNAWGNIQGNITDIINTFKK